MNSRRRTTALTAIVLGATLSLTGCFGNPLENLVNQGVEGAIESATGGLLGGSSGELPDGFPTEIPIIPGDVQGGFGVNVEGAQTWTAVVNASGGSVEEAGAHIAQQMSGAGFEASEIGASIAGRSMATYTKDQLTVLVTVTSDDSGTVSATYIVNRKA